MRKTLYAVLCALGGGLVGCFASKLSSFYGSFLFTIGIILMVYGITKLSKE